MDSDGFVWAKETSVPQTHRRQALAKRGPIARLEARIAELERQRSAWEQERAALILAATARPVDLVFSLPSVARGLQRIARRAAGLALDALRERIPV